MKTTADFHQKIIERAVARHPELAEATDREAAARVIIHGATGAERARAMQSLAIGGRGHRFQKDGADEANQAALAEMDAAHANVDTIELAAMILLERAMDAAGKVNKERVREWRTRSDERLADYLLTKYNDVEGFVSLTIGGPEGFDASRYFVGRVSLVRARFKKQLAAKRRGAGDTAPEATLRKAKDNVRSARARLKRAEGAVARAKAACEKADLHVRDLIFTQVSGPIVAANERVEAAKAALRKSEDALREAEKAMDGKSS